MKAKDSDNGSWLDKHSTAVVAVATIALVLATIALTVGTVVIAFANRELVRVTRLYLEETRKQRLVMEKAISVDISPMVFIDNVKTEFRMNNKKRCLDVKTLFVIKNSGKTEARNIQFSYVLTYKNGKEVRNSAIPFQYLFPGQQITCDTELITLFTKPEDFTKLKEQLQSKNVVTIKEVTFLKEVREELEGLELSIELKYEDREGKEVKWPHFFQYSVSKNKWNHLWKDIK